MDFLKRRLFPVSDSDLAPPPSFRDSHPSSNPEKKTFWKPDNGKLRQFFSQSKNLLNRSFKKQKDASRREGKASNEVPPSATPSERQFGLPQIPAAKEDTWSAELFQQFGVQDNGKPSARTVPAAGPSSPSDATVDKAHLDAHDDWAKELLDQFDRTLTEGRPAVPPTPSVAPASTASSSPATQSTHSRQNVSPPPPPSATDSGSSGQTVPVGRRGNAIRFNQLAPPTPTVASRIIQKGGGVSATTYSKLVLDQTTVTPRPVNQRIMPYRGSTPRLRQAAPVPTAGNEPVASPIIKPPENSCIAHAGDKLQFFHLLGQEKYFRQADNSPACRNALLDVLTAVKSRIESTTAPPVASALPIAGADMVVVTGALSAVCKSRKIGMADAARGMACLCNLDLIDGIRNPLTAPPQGPIVCPQLAGGQSGRTAPYAFDRSDHDLAWRIAQELSATPAGLAALKKLSARSQPAAALPPATDPQRAQYEKATRSLAEHDDQMLTLFLRGGREKLREAAQRGTASTLAADPLSLHHHRQEKPAERWTLLDKGLHTVSAHLRESQAYGASLHATLAGHGDAQAPAVPATYADGPTLKTWPYRDPHEWTVGALHNGVYTDAERDFDGKPSLFHLMQSRLDKHDTWVARAVAPTAEPTATEIARAALTKAEIALLPSHHKSPYFALAVESRRKTSGRPGTRNDGKPPAGVKDGFSNAMQGILGDARQMRDAMTAQADLMRVGNAVNDDPALVKGQPMPADMLPADDDKRHAMLLRMAQVAVLEHTLGEPRPLWHLLHADSLQGDGAREKAKARFDGFLSGASADDRRVFDDLIDRTFEVTPELLAAWAKPYGAPAHGAEVRELLDSGEPNPWYAWAKSLNRVFGNKPYVDTAGALDSRASLAEAMAAGIGVAELGTKANLSSGGKLGASTKGVSGAISNVAMGFAGGGRVDLRGETSALAVVEYATGAHGNELFFGTRKGWYEHKGGGAFVGTTLANGVVGVTAGVDGFKGGDTYDQSGVYVRFSRTETGMMGDAGNNRKLGEVMAKLINPPARPDGNHGATDTDTIRRFAPGEDGQSSLKNLWQEWPELSTCWSTARGHTNVANVTPRAAIGVAAGDLRIGAGVAVPVEHRTYVEEHVESEGAALGILKLSKGNQFNLGLAGGAGALSTAQRLLGADGNALAVDGMPVSLGIFGVDMATIQANLLRHGRGTTDTIIFKDGAVHKRSYRLVSYQSADEFEKATARKLDVYAAEKRKKFGYGRGYASAARGETPREANDRTAALATQYRKGAEFLADARDSARPSQIFQEYLELKDDAVATANTVKSMRDTYKKMGDDQAAQECDKYLRDLLTDDNSWEETFLIQAERQLKEKSVRINAILRSARVKARLTTDIRNGY